MYYSSICIFALARDFKELCHPDILFPNPKKKILIHTKNTKIELSAYLYSVPKLDGVMY